MRATELPTVPNPTIATLQVEGDLTETTEARFANDFFFFMAGTDTDLPAWTFLRSLCFDGFLWRSEKVIMQVPHAMRDVALFNYETDVDFRCTLGNHADVHSCLGNSIKNIGGNAGSAVNIVAHQTDDRLLSFRSDLSDLF